MSCPTRRMISEQLWVQMGTVWVSNIYSKWIIQVYCDTWRRAVLEGGWYRSNCEFRWQRCCCCCCCYHVVTPLLDKTRMLCNNDNILVWNAGPGGREKQDRSSSNKIFREDIAWFVFLLKKENSVQFCEWQQDLALQAFQSVFKRCLELLKQTFYKKWIKLIWGGSPPLLSP